MISTEARSRVFIVQDSGRFKFTKALRFGELVPLIERDVFPDDVEERVVTVRNIMKAKLSTFNPVKDFLLLAGDPIAIVIATMVLTCVTLNIRCLKYDRENQDYYEVQLSV